MKSIVPNTPLTQSIALIADDTLSNRTLLSRLLVKSGYTVLEAENGQQAVDIFSTDRPNIVFMDASMPLMDGFQACRQIKALSKDDFVPVIFITALNNENRAKCIEAGGDDFLAMPYDINVLKSKILSMERIRGMYRQMRELNQTLKAEHQLSQSIFEYSIFAKNTHIKCIKTWFQANRAINNDIFLVMHTPANGLNVFLGNFNITGPAAVIGAFPCSEVFRAMTRKGFSGRDIIESINDKLINILPEDIHMSAIFLHINEQLNQIQICNLGMPDVLIISDENQSIKTINAQPYVLGKNEELINQRLFKTHEINSNNRIALFGSGLIQSENTAHENFGDVRLLNAVKKGMQTKDILTSVKSSLASFIQSNTCKQTRSVIEIPCTSELSPQKSQIQSEIEASKKVTHDTINLKNAIDFKLTINGKNLRYVDPVPTLINFLQSITSLNKHSESLFTIFTELYINALDHGVLKLESSLKNTPNGFSEYFDLKDKRLASLKTGYIIIKLTFEADEKLNRLKIFIEDSGAGFDFDNKITEIQPAATILSGRGILLIRALCDSLEFHGRGNQSTSIYTWPIE